jgi:hypothetical protein
MATTKIHTISSPSQTKKLSWETPKLVRLGVLSSLVLGGGGKLSVIGGDPGENRKQVGGDPLG